MKIKFIVYKLILVGFAIIGTAQASEPIFQKNSFDINATKLPPIYMGVDSPNGLYTKLKSFASSIRNDPKKVLEPLYGKLKINSLFALKSDICTLKMSLGIRHDDGDKNTLVFCGYYDNNNYSISLKTSKIDSDEYRWSNYELSESNKKPLEALFKLEASTQFRFYINLTKAEFKKVKSGKKILGTLILFTPVAPYTNDSDNSKSHDLYPYRMPVTYNHSIIADIKEIWLYDFATGKIYKKIKAKKN